MTDIRSFSLVPPQPELTIGKHQLTHFDAATLPRQVIIDFAKRGSGLLPIAGLRFVCDKCNLRGTPEELARQYCEDDIALA